MITRHVLRQIAAIAVIVLVPMTVAPVLAAGSAPLQPMILGWEQQFRIDAQPGTRGGQVGVNGIVWNTSPWAAKRIQLLVESLGPSGEPIAQKVVWLGIDLASGEHAFFDVPMPTGTSYRVRVFAYDSSRGRHG